MNISELPEQYKALAEERRKENEANSQSDFLADAFDWTDTPEGAYFWIQCHNADDEADLPSLPESK